MSGDGPAAPAPAATAFSEALGPQMGALAPAVRALHAGPGRFTGRISLLSPDPAWLGLRRISAALRDAPLEMRIARQGEEDLWERRIAGRAARSRQRSIGPGLVAETVGPVTAVTELRVENGVLRMTGRRLSFLGLPIPRALWRIETEERELDGRYQFDIRVGPAFAPGLLRYRGWLDTLGAAP